LLRITCRSRREGCPRISCPALHKFSFHFSVRFLTARHRCYQYLSCSSRHTKKRENKKASVFFGHSIIFPSSRFHIIYQARRQICHSESVNFCFINIIRGQLATPPISKRGWGDFHLQRFDEPTDAPPTAESIYPYICPYIWVPPTSSFAGWWAVGGGSCGGRACQPVDLPLTVVSVSYECVCVCVWATESPAGAATGSRGSGRISDEEKNRWP